MFFFGPSGGSRRPLSWELIHYMSIGIIYIYIYICIRMHLYIYIYVYMYIYLCVYLFVCICVCIYIYVPLLRRGINTSNTNPANNTCINDLLLVVTSIHMYITRRDNTCINGNNTSNTNAHTSNRSIHTMTTTNSITLPATRRDARGGRGQDRRRQRTANFQTNNL